MPIPVDRLNRIGIPDKAICFISATGTHRAQTEAEHNAMLGKDLYQRIKIIDHDCDDKKHLKYIGAAAMAKPDFLLNVVTDDNQDIVGVFAGNWVTAHAAATGFVEKLYGIHVGGRAPLVLASAGGTPKDINLYQSPKTLVNALEMVALGGTIIMLSQCSEGIGSPDCQHILCDYDTLAERENALRKDFINGGYMGYLFEESAEKYHLIIVSDLDARQFTRALLHITPTLDEALKIAADLNGGSPDGVATALMPHGASTFPIQGQEQ